MEKRVPTSVNLTKKAQAIKDKYAPLGLKGILSVGLELFNKLTDTEKINRVGQVLAEDAADEIVSGAEADAAKQKQKRVRKPSKSA